MAETARFEAPHRHACVLRQIGGPRKIYILTVVPQIVVDVRLSEGLILIDPPEGLLDLIQPKRTERVVIRGLLPERAASLVDADGPG